MPSKEGDMSVDLVVKIDKDVFKEHDIVKEFFDCGKIRPAPGSKVPPQQVSYLREACMMSTIVSGLYTLNKRLDGLEKECGK